MCFHVSKINDEKLKDVFAKKCMRTGCGRNAALRWAHGRRIQKSGWTRPIVTPNGWNPDKADIHLGSRVGVGLTTQPGRLPSLLRPLCVCAREHFSFSIPLPDCFTKSGRTVSSGIFSMLVQLFGCMILTALVRFCSRQQLGLPIFFVRCPE